MNIQKLVVTAVILVEIFASCKEKEVFPSETQQGLNTFGVKIDGKKWLPERGVSVVGAPEKLVGYYLKETGVVSITARKGINDEVIQLIALNVNKAGNYRFNADSVKSDVTKFEGKNINDSYYLVAGGTNELVITKLDTVNQIISGTFALQLRGQKTTSIKNLTQGIFDINYEK